MIRPYVMAKCDRCGAMAPPEEAPNWCPECGKARLTPVFYCRSCRDWFDEEENDHDYCKACAKATVDKFQFVLSKNFTPDDVDWLNNKYDGEAFP